jgi:hypothetical protein
LARPDPAGDSAAERDANAAAVAALGTAPGAARAGVS